MIFINKRVIKRNLVLMFTDITNTPRHPRKKTKPETRKKKIPVLTSSHVETKPHKPPRHKNVTNQFQPRSVRCSSYTMCLPQSRQEILRDLHDSINITFPSKKSKGTTVSTHMLKNVLSRMDHPSKLGQGVSGIVYKSGWIAHAHGHAHAHAIDDSKLRGESKSDENKSNECVAVHCTSGITKLIVAVKFMFLKEKHPLLPSRHGWQIPMGFESHSKLSNMWRELLLARTMNMVILSNICPGFQGIFNPIHIADMPLVHTDRPLSSDNRKLNFKFFNTVVECDRTADMSLIKGYCSGLAVIQEFANFTLVDYLFKARGSGHMVDIAAISGQVIFAQAVLHSRIGVLHNDNHCNNVMGVFTNEDFIYYEIDGSVFAIPTYGVRWVLIDFGQSTSDYLFDPNLKSVHDRHGRDHAAIWEQWKFRNTGVRQAKKNVLLQNPFGDVRKIAEQLIFVLERCSPEIYDSLRFLTSMMSEVRFNVSETTLNFYWETILFFLNNTELQPDGVSFKDWVHSCIGKGTKATHSTKKLFCETMSKYQIKKTDVPKSKTIYDFNGKVTAHKSGFLESFLRMKTI